MADRGGAGGPYWWWLDILTIRTNLESVTNDRRHHDEAKWGPPRQSDAEAVEQAAAMVDRFNRVFLRTLRALCEMRRHGSPVIVQSGGQVNVAQQQVNVNSGTKSTRSIARTEKAADRRSSGRGRCEG